MTVDTTAPNAVGNTTLAAPPSVRRPGAGVEPEPRADGQPAELLVVAGQDAAGVAVLARRAGRDPPGHRLSGLRNVRTAVARISDTRIGQRGIDEHPGDGRDAGEQERPVCVDVEAAQILEVSGVALIGEAQPIIEPAHGMGVDSDGHRGTRRVVRLFEGICGMHHAVCADGQRQAGVAKQPEPLRVRAAARAFLLRLRDLLVSLLLALLGRGRNGADDAGAGDIQGDARDRPCPTNRREVGTETGAAGERRSAADHIVELKRVCIVELLLRGRGHSSN